MFLSIGFRPGSYEILSLVGVGGMGAVYRARDTKLGRDVAIKVLPEDFAQNAERMARFQREAKLLAALNHLVGVECFPCGCRMAKACLLHSGLPSFESEPCHNSAARIEVG